MTEDSSGHTRQLVVALLDSDNDTTTPAQAVALDRKQRVRPVPSEVVEIRRASGGARGNVGDPAGAAELGRALEGGARVPLAVDGRSRLYLVGVGRPDPRTVSGWSPEALAALLSGAGLREVGVVSIVADGAGRDPGRADDAQTDPQATSFASELHRILWTAHGLRTTIKARIGSVRVLTEDELVDGAALGAGRKLTAPYGRPDAREQHHAHHSKLRLSWAGDTQQCHWCD